MTVTGKVKAQTSSTTVDWTKTSESTSGKTGLEKQELTAHLK